MVHRREGSGAASCNGLLVVAGHWVLVLGVFRYFSTGAHQHVYSCLTLGVHVSMIRVYSLQLSLTPYNFLQRCPGLGNYPETKLRDFSEFLILGMAAVARLICFDMGGLASSSDHGSPNPSPHKSRYEDPWREGSRTPRRGPGSPGPCL